MKEKSQALKGDVPGKFKIPKKSGKECCPGHQGPHLPRLFCSA